MKAPSSPVFRRLSAALLILAVGAGCNASLHRGDRQVKSGDWLKAVASYRRAVQKEPDSVRARAKLRQAELDAAKHFYKAGKELEDQGFLDAALYQYRQGLTAIPGQEKLSQALTKGEAMREARSLMKESGLLEAAGKRTRALDLAEKAAKADPELESARQAVQRLRKATKKRGDGELTLTSRDPITLNFKGTSLRTAFEFVAKSFGVNVIFDEDVKNSPVTIFARNVTFEQALSLMLTTSRTFYKQVGPNTLLVAPDNSSKRAQYEDYFIRSFQLGAVKAVDMAGLLKGAFNLKKVVINEDLNAVVVRDTEEVLGLVEKFVANNDRRPPEIMFEVEILEVNQNKVEQLGLDYGSRISATFPAIGIDQLRVSTFRDILDQGTVTLPALTFNFFKQDVDAEVLANPKVRVLNNQTAKIHIGDRVPLRSSTIQDTTGQVRFTFEYRDIGIRLEVKPRVHLDHSVTVKLDLEVSSLGANLGTDDEPAFSIGTRNADSIMSLRDGETAVLGGLIRDEERHNIVRIPGLGDLPLVGKIFATGDDSSKVRTDVLLTITPHVLRGWDLPAQEDRQFFSGTENSYTGRKQFASLNAPASGGKQPAFSVGSAAGGAGTLGSSDEPAAASVDEQSLRFSTTTFEASAGGEVVIPLVGSRLEGATLIPLGLAYNPRLLRFERLEAGDVELEDRSADADDEKGIVSVRLKAAKPGLPKGRKVLAKLVLKAIKPGVSYLVYRDTRIQAGKGEGLRPQLHASRVLIK